jgi:hypothetical protein
MSTIDIKERLRSELKAQIRMQSPGKIWRISVGKFGLRVLSSVNFGIKFFIPKLNGHMLTPKFSTKEWLTNGPGLVKRPFDNEALLRSIRQRRLCPEVRHHSTDRAFHR